MDVEPLGRTNGVSVGKLGSMLVCVFARSEPEDFDLLERHQAQLTLVHGKLSTVNIVNEASLKIDPGAAKRSKELVDRFGDQMICSCTVVRARGLAAVVSHTFLTTFTLLNLLKMPYQVFRDTETAAKWMQALPDQNDEIRAMFGLGPALERFAALGPGRG